MRLLRYAREGLVQRRRRQGQSKTYEYSITRKGEDRLVHLWKALGFLKVPEDWRSQGELGRLDKELAERRRQIAIGILRRHQVEDELELARGGPNSAHLYDGSFRASSRAQ